MQATIRRVVALTLIAIAAANGDPHVSTFVEMSRTVNAGDAKGYARLYAADATISIAGGAPLKGRAAIERYEIDLLRQYPGTQLAFYAMWNDGEQAVVHYAVNGATTTGQKMGHEGLLFYRFRKSGLIAEERRYNDSMTPMAQLGMFGSAPARALPDLPTEMKSFVARGAPRELANVAIVRAHYAAWNSHDQTRLLSMMSDDAVLDELTSLEPFRGRRGVTAWFDSWARAVPDAKADVTYIHGVGDFVLVESIVRGTLNGTIGRISAATKPFVVHRATIVELKGGKIVRLSAFMNGKELAQAVGEWPPKPAK